MLDREKVMAALKCVANLETELTAECRERGCPYVGRECERSVAADALALLKEQEARVMLKEEVVDLLQGSVVWYEEKSESGTYLRAMISAGNGFLGDFYLGVNAHELELKRQRFWTSRPSPEQMRETKWEGDSDD